VEEGARQERADRERDQGLEGPLDALLAPRQQQEAAQRNGADPEHAEQCRGPGAHAGPPPGIVANLTLASSVSRDPSSWNGNASLLQGGRMSSIVKVIEVIAQSPSSFDDAVRNAVKEVAKTVTGVKSVWVDNFSCNVTGDQITEFRVNVKVSFMVEGHK
jgi:flavin-binding protein dodecin